MLAWLLVAALGLAPLAAQRGAEVDVCPYCRNDPELMAKAGVVNHGGFEFGNSDTSRAQALLAGTGVKWIETAHFQIGIGLAPYKLKEDEKKKVRGELERLALVLPEVDPKTRVLDPWLRVHLFGQRCEDLWQRVLTIFGVQESQFPDGSKPWDLTGKYMGEGPFLGEKGKYELLIVPSEAAMTTYLRTEFGLTTKITQRWNILERDTLTAVMHNQQDNLREDTGLHGHVFFNLAINLFDGYKHYSYDGPVWIREGLAHYLEREVSPKFNTFDSSEGAAASVTRKEKWGPEVRKLIAAGEAPRMAELFNMRDYAELTLARHYACWSIVDYLVQTNPKGLACVLDAIKGLTDPKGYPDGSKIPEAHRNAFKQCLGFASYAEFDAAWAAWADTAYDT